MESYLLASFVEPCIMLCLIHSYVVIIILRKDHGSIDLGTEDVVAKCFSSSKDRDALLILKRRSLDLGNKGGMSERSDLLFFKASAASSSVPFLFLGGGVISSSSFVCYLLAQ